MDEIYKFLIIVEVRRTKKGADLTFVNNVRWISDFWLVERAYYIELSSQSATSR